MLEEKQEYLDVQYSTEFHSHTRSDDSTYSHAHRTYLTFHGHDGLPVIDSVNIVEIIPKGKILKQNKNRV